MFYLIFLLLYIHYINIFRVMSYFIDHSKQNEIHVIVNRSACNAKVIDVKRVYKK